MGHVGLQHHPSCLPRSHQIFQPLSCCYRTDLSKFGWKPMSSQGIGTSAACLVCWEASDNSVITSVVWERHGQPLWLLSPCPQLAWIVDVAQRDGQRGAAPGNWGVIMSANTENTESSLLFVSPSPVRSHKQMTLPKALLKENIKCPRTGLVGVEGIL